ncbi:Hypothetical protein NTJ_04574 [Nesidiocoris tenuis]|nr:Hypothetical protein NTJ_04574 [Nesidiocoris tenuis]
MRVHQVTKRRECLTSAMSSVVFEFRLCKVLRFGREAALSNGGATPAKAGAHLRRMGGHRPPSRLRCIAPLHLPTPLL